MPNSETQPGSKNNSGTRHNDYVILDQWAEAALLLPDPKQQAAFWNAIARYALHAERPQSSDVIGQMAFAMSARMIDIRNAKKEAGRRGGKKNAKQTGSKAEADAKQTGSKAEADAKQTGSKAEADAKQTGRKAEADEKQNRS